MAVATVGSSWKIFGQERVETALGVRHPRSLRRGADGDRYHAAMPSQTWVNRSSWRARASASSRSGRTTSPICRRSRSTCRSGSGRSWVRRTRPGSRWVDTALANQDAGTERPFATIDLASGRAIGSSRFLSIVPEHRRLEIGWTWLGTAFQRTGVNREAKLLQLTHAFETLGANRVELKTHHMNERSKAAMAALGATFEGTFRNHMIMPDGSLRHSAYFSVIAEEWPDIKARLVAGLAR